MHIKWTILQYNGTSKPWLAPILKPSRNENQLVWIHWRRYWYWNNSLQIHQDRYSLIETAEQIIGYLKPPLKKTPVPWWNNEIKQSISLKNKALKTFIKTRSLEDHIKLKELRAKTRFLVKNNKTITWRNFTSNIGAQTDPHIMWNKIRSLQGRKKHNNIYLSTNSSLNTNPSSVAHILGKYFEKNSSNEIKPNLRHVYSPITHKWFIVYLLISPYWKLVNSTL